MKKGVGACALLVTLGQGVAGCAGSDPSYNPISPSPPAPPPPPPPFSLAVDLRGDYDLTIEVGNACEQVPSELRRRTYELTISYFGFSGSTDIFLAELSGATFRDQQPVWVEATHRESGSSVWLNLADTVILEAPERDTYFMIAGGNGVASVEPTELSTISTRFTGYFDYCVVGPQNQCSSDAMMHSLCTSENSRWTLTRR